MLQSKLPVHWQSIIVGLGYVKALSFVSLSFFLFLFLYHNRIFMTSTITASFTQAPYMVCILPAPLKTWQPYRVTGQSLQQMLFSNYPGRHILFSNVCGKDQVHSRWPDCQRCQILQSIQKITMERYEKYVFFQCKGCFYKESLLCEADWPDDLLCGWHATSSDPLHVAGNISTSKTAAHQMFERLKCFKLKE